MGHRSLWTRPGSGVSYNFVPHNHACPYQAMFEAIEAQ